MQSKLLAFLAAITLISCGRSANSNSSLRVTNGISLKSTDFPSVVMLYREQGDNGGVCTGTWISDRVVLTAAHCFMGLPQGPNGEVTTSVNMIEPKDGMRVTPAAPCSIAVSI